MMMTYQCRFFDDNRCTTLVRGIAGVSIVGRLWGGGGEKRDL